MIKSNLLDNLFLNIKNSNPIKYKKIDSQTRCPKEFWLEAFYQKALDEIHFINKSKYIHNSFFHNFYIKEIIRYCHEGLFFKNCIFDLDPTEIEELFFLSEHEFKNCTVYLSNSANNDYYYIKKAVELILETTNLTENNVKFIYTSYSNNLLNNHLYNKNFNMLHINHLNLENKTIPKDPNFFKNLSNNIIRNVNFPNINLSNYNLDQVRFVNCTFAEESKIPDSLLRGAIEHSTLPIIHFKNESIYSLNGCKIHNKSTFPESEDFFLIGNKFINCSMPEYNYSNYKINNDTFDKCSFTKTSVLPKEIYHVKNHRTLLNISLLPDEAVKFASRYVSIRNKEDFIDKYNSCLTFEEKFILKNLK